MNPFLALAIILDSIGLPIALAMVGISAPNPAADPTNIRYSSVAKSCPYLLRKYAAAPASKVPAPIIFSNAPTIAPFPCAAAFAEFRIIGKDLNAA